MSVTIGERIAIQHGLFFEDFEPGRRFDHHWGRTIVAFDTVLFSSITMHYNPVYFNREYARSLGYEDILVNPLFLLYLTLGLSVEDLTEAGGPFLGLSDAHVHTPVYPGVTLYSRSEVVSQRASESRPGWGIVEWHTEGYDSQGRVLIDLRRRNLSKFRKAPTDEGSEEAQRPPRDVSPVDQAAPAPPTRVIPAGGGRYFEDFVVGQVYLHGRGKTIGEMDNYLATHLTMNTAQAHFNLAYMESFFGGQFHERLVVGGCTMSTVLGLTAQDMSEHALCDLGYDKIRLPNPVFHGDSLFAESAVLELRSAPDRQDAGIMRYRATGRNQRGAVVFEGERSVLLKCRGKG